jgi:hypothetical protein
MQWIKIEDQKPQHRQRLLATNGEHVELCIWNEKNQRFYATDQSNLWHNLPEGVIITHWMPLPHPKQPDLIRAVQAYYKSWILNLDEETQMRFRNHMFERLQNVLEQQPQSAIDEDKVCQCGHSFRQHRNGTNCIMCDCKRYIRV